MPFDPCNTCSHLNRDTQMTGSAPTEQAYVVVEVAKPWPRKIKKAADLPEELRAIVKRAPVDGALIGTPPSGSERRVRVYRRDGLTTLCDSFAYNPERLQEALSGQPKGSPAEPVLLVCTHGSRDACCGRLGVPLLKATSPRRQLLECSHLGGHRFAPVVLALPEWRFYGRLTPEAMEGFLERLAAGQPDPVHYRGCGLWPGPVQVVEAELWKRLGSPPRFRQVEVEEETVRVQLSSGEQYEARVEKSSFETIASCRDIDDQKMKNEKYYRLQELLVLK
ncbi:MAG: hypothetical protein KC910_01465 [Candidatus Eremiobacteraeota bacterium]|nr:hypothetical protein [Candidatus Eremiobacteraeota bacterium]